MKNEKTNIEQMFYTAYNRPKTEKAEAGSKEEPVYQMRVDERGNKILVKTGMTNIYDIIQENLEDSKIQNIIRRATEGDPYALAQMNGQYIDTTDVPKTLAEAQQFVIRARQEFESLPISVRRKFNMSAEKYIATYGTSEWMYATEELRTTTKTGNTETEVSAGNKVSAENTIPAENNQT